MAERVQVYSVTVPAGTAQATPLDTSLPMVEGVTRRVEFIVPPGPSGLVGFRIVHSGTIVIPESGTAWIVADDEKIGWDLDNFPTGAKWVFRAYNTDIYAHTIQVRWLLDEIPSAPSAPLVAVSIE